MDNEKNPSIITRVKPGMIVEDRHVRCEVVGKTHGSWWRLKVIEDFDGYKPGTTFEENETNIKAHWRLPDGSNP